MSDYRDLKDWKCNDCGRRGPHSLRWSPARYKAYCSVCHRSNTVRISELYGPSWSADVVGPPDQSWWKGEGLVSMDIETPLAHRLGYPLKGEKVVKKCPSCMHQVFVHPRVAWDGSGTYYGCPDCHVVFYDNEEFNMAMKTDPSIPPHADRVLVNKYRLLGTTDDIHTTKEAAVKQAKEVARVEGKRIYVVEVIGYAQPDHPPTTYRDNDGY